MPAPFVHWQLRRSAREEPLEPLKPSNQLLPSTPFLNLFNRPSVHLC